MKLNFKKILVVAMTIVLVSLHIGDPLYITAMAVDEDKLNGQLDDLNNEYDKLAEERAALDAKIANAKNEKEKQLAIKNQINSQITITRQEISVLTQKITLLESNIEGKEEEIRQKEADIEENFDLFLQRVRAMYMSGKTSTLELILGAEDFSTALMRAKIMESVAVHDEELINDLLYDIEQIDKEKAAFEANKLEEDAIRAELDSKKAVLDTQMSQTQKEIQNIQTLEQNYNLNKAQIDREEASLRKEMDDIYAQLDPVYEEYVGGEFLWPVPGYSNITSNFGWRFGGANWHTGIDISGSNVNGKPIVASNRGKVVLVVNNFVTGKGYGRYLIVDHGGGMSTLYAHTSKIVVAVGDTVSRGQKIAEIGTTGWSTGPHLHFEIRKDGKEQNPLNYL